MKTNNEVGGVYKKPVQVHADDDFDIDFMKELAGGVFCVLGIFALAFSLILIV